MTTVADHIPVLHTDRLRLRAQRRSDFDAYASILISDRARYMEGAKDRGEAWGAFFHESGSWIFDNFGYWTAALSESDEPVAFLGIANYPSFHEPELGWMTTAQHEGKGYAYEAAKAALAWAFGRRGLPTLVSYIDPANTRSIALAERLGASHDAAALAPDPGDLVFRHPAPEGLQ